jgi:imidazolonepropionase-like amidohydrolase
MSWSSIQFSLRGVYNVSRRYRRLGLVIAGGLLTLMLLLFALVTGLLVSVGFISVDAAYSEQLPSELLALPGTTAFVNITVIDVQGGEPLLPDHTVIVTGGLIMSVAPTDQTLVPPGATVIDGTGRYLIPGLMDAHVHIKDIDELLLYAAAGVTTVRDMWGTTGVQLVLGFPDQLAMQRRIENGELLGPRIYAAGPIMEGVPAVNPFMDTYTTLEAARQSVSWQAAQGYQFIKVYDHLSSEVYQAIVEEAGRQNLPVIGHVPHAVGLDAAVASGQHSIEHLTGFIDPERAALLIPQDQLAAYAQRAADSGIWFCPTLVLYTRVVSDAEAAVLQAQPEMRFVPLWLRHLWPFFNSQLRDGLLYTGSDYPAAINRVNFQVMAALHDAGTRFVVGTDTDNAFLIPGFAIYDEMEGMAAAGLSPLEVLQAATVHGAALVEDHGAFGAITPGQRADLVVLSANPLDDIRNIRLQEGVMLRGRWFDRQQLDSFLDNLAHTYAPILLDWLLPALFVAAAASFLITRTMLRRLQ